MKYDSPVAMPTISVEPSTSYVEGYRCGYYWGGISDDNPYVFSEGLYDWDTWEEGRLDGRQDWREGKQPKHQSAEV